MQLELLNTHEPFESIEDAQAAVEPWRTEYNASRPHQSLAMAFPAARFAPASGQALGLRVPASLASAGFAEPVTGAACAGELVAAAAAGSSQPAGFAVELDRVVPPSGNLGVAGQQIWLGPAMTGRVIRIWADTQRVRVLAGGYRIKTVPSRLGARDLTRLGANGAVPTGAPPLPPPSGEIIDIERAVSASGNISAGNHVISAGSPLAGHGSPCGWTGLSRISSLAAALSAPSPARSSRPPGTGCAEPVPQPPDHHRCPACLTVRRRVSIRGAIMIGGQRVQAGLPHAGTTAEITIEAGTCQITVEPGTVITAARTTSRAIFRQKASRYDVTAAMDRR